MTNFDYRKAILEASDEKVTELFDDLMRSGSSMVEPSAHNGLVAGSNPARSTK